MADKKRTGNLDWEDVRYFVALTRHRSLAATARALHVHHATVSRRVTHLETSIGHALFDRRADRFMLTSDGEAVLAVASAMDEAALKLFDSIDTSTTIHGPVRITVGPSLGEVFLIDRLDGLRRRYPMIDVELLGDVRLLSLARREADIALRFGAPENSELLARRVGTIAFSLYVATHLRGEPDLHARLPFIGFGKDGASIAEAEWLEHNFPKRRFAFRCNSQVAQAAAARAGFGIALLPHYLGADDPGLAEIACDTPLLERELWILIRRDATRIPRVRAVVDYLTEVFRRERHRLAGSSRQA
jgi:DNA-binding transcriptional LysR family regulator